MPLNAIFTTRPAPSVDSVPPTVLFYTDVDAAAPVHSDPDDPRSAKGSAYPVYEFVFYNGGNVRCQVQRYGTAQSFPGFASLTPRRQPGDTEIWVAGGLIDGPMPVPAVDIDHESSRDSFGTITYGSSSKSVDGHQVENTWSAGFKSEGAWKVGLAWEISFSAGQGYVDGDRTELAFENKLNVMTDVDPATGLPEPDARLFGGTAEIEVTAYRFLDRAGKAIVDGINADGPNQALLFTRTTAAFHNIEHRYTPYYAVVGDLESYTPEALNARMAKLLNGDDKIAVQAREAAGDDYFTNVIHASGYEFLDPSGSGTSDPYIEYSTGKGASTGPTYLITQADFMERGWHTDASVYAGFHGDWGAGEATILAGGSYSYKSNTSHTGETAWGITVADLDGPAPASRPRVVSDYTFRVYFLPPPDGSMLPPNYWAWELQHCLAQAPPPIDIAHLTAAQVDPLAEPWRIMFVVTRIDYKNRPPYVYVDRHRGGA
jgi:hypothetical protein